MRRLAGYVFDPYDDVDGQVLRSVIPDSSKVPDFVKKAARLSLEQIDKSPDDQFALVMIDGHDKLKKYATVDKGNTTLSVIYLLKQAHLLPAEAVKVAAGNLIEACKHWGLTVPGNLKMAAETGTSPVSGKSQSKPYARNASVSKIQFPVPEPAKQSTEDPMLGEHDGGLQEIKDRVNAQSVPGSNYLKLPAFSMKEREKNASYQYATKQQSWRQQPWVDVSGWDPSSATAQDTKPPENTLLAGKYPIDGYDQVKTASAYFEENWMEFHPRQRHEYCVKLVKRAEDLGIDVSEEAQRYGSETYAADVDSYVDARRDYVQEEFRPALDVLLEKRAQVSPGTFAESLCEFDTISGMKWHWDGKIADPWLSTFGPSIEKLANEDWRFSENGVRISVEDLENLALNGKSILKKQFGNSFMEEFAKKPKAVFDSMPKPHKVILARMAAAHNSGTHVA